MNYEVNPFQDYESITIDELKDQANSLLKLVTDEQRPLRVCMNNGKEFLLFPQDLLAPICDSDFRLILLSAMRYAMGRNTYMPAVVSDYIKRHIRFLDDKFLALAADDIRRHLEDYAEHEMNPNLWHGLLGALETEQRERATREARYFPLKCPSNYGNAIVIEEKRVSPLENEGVMLFFVYSVAIAEPPPMQKQLV